MELRRLLLVEDSPNDAALTLSAFAESGITNPIVWVKDGQEALDYLTCTGAYVGRADGLPAVVLLDLKLPKLHGLQVLARVRADAALRTLPVVMLTSSNQHGDLAGAYAGGVNAYVVKPVGFTEFVAALREIGLFWAVVNQPPPGCGARQAG